METKVILIRHGEVEPRWKRVCYGHLDVPLSSIGISKSDLLANTLSSQLTRPAAIYHSGLHRTKYLASALAEAWKGEVPLVEDLRLRERDYGTWEGQTWDAVFASDPDRFHDLIHRPDEYRPPLGETTTQVQRRIVSWFEALSPGNDSPIIAVSHSGPIASLCGALLNLPASEWEPWTVGYLDQVHIDRRHRVSRLPAT